MAASSPSPTSNSPLPSPKAEDPRTFQSANAAPASQSEATESTAAPAVRWPGSSLQLSAPNTSDGGAKDARKLSIQIKAHQMMTGEPKKRASVGARRRMSSPPPPPNFRPRVAFDTFEKLNLKEDLSAEPPSFTLTSKHKDYEYNKLSRTFLCGLDSNDYSEYALEWLIDELVDDGDEVVCLRVLEPENAKDRMTESRYREEADLIMKQMENKNHENKAINFILEFSIGKVEKVIRQMIEFYEPAILIVGTRGRSLGGFTGLIPGSISKFCLQNSPIPVIVVRPNMQRARGKRKRLQDPARQGYRDLLDRAGIEGHLLDEKNFGSVDQLGGREEEKPASQDEAAAVAAALGVGFKQARNAPKHGSPLTKIESAATDVTSPESDFGSEAEGVRLMKSPELQDLDSPELSGESAFGDDDIDPLSGPTSPSFQHNAPNVLIRRPTADIE